MARKICVIAVGVLLMCMWVVPVQAGSNEAQLQQRVDQLEQQIKELKALLQQQQQTYEADKARVEKIEQRVDTAEKTVKASPTVISANNFTFKPYGYVKLDAAYDDSRTNYGDFILYALSEGTRKNDNEFNMTARQTRIGVDIMAPTIDNWTAKGRVEFDFYGDGSARHENKPEVMLRHAFVDLVNGNFGLLAGQTSDLFSPLAPSTLNYTVGWAAGNIGYRRPQLRLTYGIPVNDKNKVTTALAFARTTGTANEDLDLDLENDGEDSGFPSFQGRVAWATKLFTATDSVFGVSGHFGKEEIDWGVLTPGGHQDRMKTWSVNGDITIPLSPCLTFMGEAFVGENLDDFFGGVLQGVNSTLQEEIKSVGGWAQLNYKYDTKWQTNLGFGIDDPDNDDLNAGNRSRNAFYFANVLYNLIAPVNLGLEYSYWDTDYKNRRGGVNNRIQTSVIYSW